MKGLSAGLTFLNLSTVSALVLGILGGGLNKWIAFVSFLFGAAAAMAAYLGTFDPEANREVVDSPKAESKLSKRAQRRLQRITSEIGATPAKPYASLPRYSSLWLWGVAACFTIFAVRSFCWLLYIDGEQLRIQSPNNLGDLALHITYIRNFANGVALWPDNPIYVFSKLRYPAGMDLFNALLSLLHVDLARGLVWTGLLASLATFYAFFRWGGTFAVAGFLFNGGIAGFKFLNPLNGSWGEFLDYQGDTTIAWKSIPLAMFVTQRGLLYSIPAGLLLLWHWREKFFRNSAVAEVTDSGKPADRLQQSQLQPLPFWVELSLYASMPLFHVHTFLALTVVLICLFVASQRDVLVAIITLLASAFIPATFFVWLITDHFQAHSVLEWSPGWVLHAGDFAHPLKTAVAAGVARGFFHSLWQFFNFWFINFGLTIPAIILLIVFLAIKAWKQRADQSFVAIPLELVFLALAALLVALATPFLHSWRRYVFVIALCIIPLVVFMILGARNQRLPITPSLAFVIPGIAIFVLAYLFKMAPWEWDNLKIMIWAYFIVLPLLWTELIRRWDISIRVGICIALFGSGFVSLLGGLAAKGFAFENRGEVDSLGVATRMLPVEARFAAYPTYNHPLLLQGRKVVLGYPGHLWTQGFDYSDANERLGNLMQGKGDWREAARRLQVRYIFWGREEQLNYPTSTRPWENALTKVASGTWGAIYDLEAPLKQ